MVPGQELQALLAAYTVPGWALFAGYRQESLGLEPPGLEHLGREPPGLERPDTELLEQVLLVVDTQGRLV